MDSAQLCIIMKTATIFMFLCQRMVNKVNIYYTPPIVQKCKGLDFNIFYLRIQKIKSSFGFNSLLLTGLSAPIILITYSNFSGF